MPDNVTIIIPTYNEALNIQKSINMLLSATTPYDEALFSILVIDSASTDDTATKVRQLSNVHRNIHLIEEPQKTGLGSAYAQAMQYAIDHLHADIIVEYDADGSHDASSIIPMLQRLQQGADVVVGSRYVPGGKIPKDWGWHRKALSVFGNLLARLFISRKYHDLTSGFRASRVEFLKPILAEGFLSNHYAYKLHVFCQQHSLGARIEEYPIVFIDREKGYSKLPRNSIIDSLRVLSLLRLRLAKRYLATSIVGLFGFALQLIVYNLLRFTLSPFTANLIAIECAILFNFRNNNRFSFKQQRIHQHDIKKWFKKLGQFNLFCVASAVIQMVILSSYHHFLHPSRLNENIALIVGILIGSLVNYWVYANWIWKPLPADDEADESAI